MEKRAFIAVAISLLILVLYQEWISRYYGTPPPAQTPAPKEAEKPAPSAPPLPPPVAKEATKPVPSAAGEAGKEIKVDTDNYVAIFTTKGARLKSFKLKKYRSSVDEKSPPVEIITAEPGVPLPLGVSWRVPAPVDDADLVYQVQGENLDLTDGARATLVFQGQTPDGVLITKSFRFSGSTYPIELEVSVKRPDGQSLAPEVLVTDRADHNTLNADAKFEGFIALVDNKIKRETPPEANKGHEFAGNIGWAGFGHTYFLFAILPDNGAQNKTWVHHAGAALIAGITGPPDNGRYTVFIGPKDLDTLKSLGRGLDRSIDFGLFGFGEFISVPLVYILHFFHRFTHSYGLDIILLTVLIKLLMAPLTHKSYASMKQMQKLQPQMEKLKERFADDKEKLNKEIMELYRRNGVNPLGGCLPMLLQFPVFIGLYNALSTPIELRHAPFLWIKDLSQPDWRSLPFTVPDWWPSSLPAGVPVLTILMGASMFVQQWMTPSAGDPNQRKMMMIMPLMFTFMFVSFPAGLTVYWLVNNILTIAQQYWINRREH
jgi:YidC/Oxa1 family membrane protein insertase